MPVSRENYWCSRITKFFYVFVKSEYNFVSIRNRERAAWAEIVLDINNYQVRLFVNLNLQRLPQMRPLRDEIKPTSHANS